MKKALIMLVAATIAVFAAWADTEIVDGIEWTYIIEGVDATVGDNSDAAVPEDTEGTIVVPARLGGHDVTRIGDSAFSGCAICIQDSLKEQPECQKNTAEDLLRHCLSSRHRPETFPHIFLQMLFL